MLFVLLAACDLSGAPSPTSADEVLYEVPKGATARGLAADLASHGLVQDAWRWEWWVRLESDGGGCIKAGKHRVKASMDAPDLLAALCGPPVPEDVPFTVVEGWRARDIDAALAAKGLGKPGDYLAAVHQPAAWAWKVDFPLPSDTLEGFLYPETYMVTPDRFEVHALIQRQLDTFDQRWYHAAKASLPRPLHDIVVMASMIEREEPSPVNRPLIAGILWKRIDAGWNLGVDATSRYGLDDWNDRDAFMKKLRDPADPYNTRLRQGLPPTPIGNPSVVALTAAASPEDNDYWYYLHDSTQQIHPARTVAEHEAFRRKYNVY